MLNKNEILFVGGILTNDSSLWINNGKMLSRNYRQGNRVYSSYGVSTAITAEPIGGLGGQTSLYIVRLKTEVINNDRE